MKFSQYMKKLPILAISIIVIIIISAGIYYTNLDDSNQGIKISDTGKQKSFCLSNDNLLGIDIDIKNKLCNNFFKTEYDNISELPSAGRVNINSYGFRNIEFTSHNSSDAVRIFLVGSSTIYGSSNDDQKTISSQLQLNYDQSSTTNVQVINAGISAFGDSIKQTNLIKEKIVNFSPDLIIIHDGINDMIKESPDSYQDWYIRWSEICMLGKEKDFKTIMTIQPFVGTGNKILSENEIRIYNESGLNDELEKYDNFIMKLNELKDHCTLVYDTSHAFDKISSNVYIDNYHFGDRGSKILADKFFEISLPIVESIETSNAAELKIIENQRLENAIDTLLDSDYSLSKMNFANMNLQGRDFSYKDLTGSSFYNTNLQNSSFENSILNNSNFLGSNLDNANLRNSQIKDSNIIKTSIKNTNFENANFDASFFFMIDFSRSNLDNSKIKDAKILGSNFGDLDLSLIDLTNVDFGSELDEEQEIQILIEKEDYVQMISHNWPSSLFRSVSIEQWFCNSYQECVSLPDNNDVIVDKVTNKRVYPMTDKLELLPKNTQLYAELELNIDQRVGVIFPTFTSAAYTEPCFWSYYVEIKDESCLTVKLKPIDLNNPGPSSNNYQHYPGWFFNTSNMAVQTFSLLGYNMISEIDIHDNPEYLNTYDKIIVLHNQFVTKPMFDAITTHNKVVYLYPNSLYAEISYNSQDETITLLHKHNYPAPKINNDFDWIYDNTDVVYQDCLDVENIKFERINNGIMLNCYPENIIHASPELLKLIRDF